MICLLPGMPSSTPATLVPALPQMPSVGITLSLKLSLVLHFPREAPIPLFCSSWFSVHFSIMVCVEEIPPGAWFRAMVLEGMLPGEAVLWAFQVMFYLQEQREVLEREVRREYMRKAPGKSGAYGRPTWPVPYRGCGIYPFLSLPFEERRQNGNQDTTVSSLLVGKNCLLGWTRGLY